MAHIILLVFDDFNMKDLGKEHTYHLITILKEHYKVKED